MAQLARIGTIVKQRWDLKENLQSSNKKSKKEDGDNDEKSKDRPKGSQDKVKEETSLTAFCQNMVFCFLITLNFILLDLLYLYCVSKKI